MVFERPYSAIRCQVLFDIMYAITQLPTSDDNIRLLELVRRQLPEDLRGVKFLDEDQMVSGMTGWIRTKKETGLVVPGWIPVGPNIPVLMMDSDSDNEEAEVAEIIEDPMEVGRATVQDVEDIETGDQPQAVDTVDNIEPVEIGNSIDAVNTGDPVNAVEAVGTCEAAETFDAVETAGASPPQNACEAATQIVAQLVTARICEGLDMD